VIRWNFANKFGLPVKTTASPSVISRDFSPEEATLTYSTALLRDAREEIDRADAKASILLAASGVAVGAFLAGLIAGSWSPLKLEPAIQWAWWLGMAELGVGIGCLALAIYPRERQNDSRIPWAVAYYGDVMAYPTTAELVAALKRSSETSIDRVADQLRHVSWIANHKYRLLRWGMRGLFLAAPTITAATLINLLLLRY
jgi:hypothetical protein